MQTNITYIGDADDADAYSTTLIPESCFPRFDARFAAA